MEQNLEGRDYLHKNIMTKGVSNDRLINENTKNINEKPKVNHKNSNSKMDAIFPRLGLALLVFLSIVGLLLFLPKIVPEFENSKFNLSKHIMKTFKTIDSDEAEKLIKENKDLVIVDIRTPIEFKGGKIDKAINIDFQNKNFVRDLSYLDKDTPYLFYCNSGNRTKMATETIKGLGFKNVYILDGGILAWVDAGKEVKRNDGFEIFQN